MADVESRPATRSRTTTAERPLSPHLEVYTLSLTMIMSGLHRITGMVLCLGILLLVWWLVALSGDAGSFQTAANVLGSWFGRLVIFGFSWTLFHHLLGGVRHAIWDTGRGMDHPEREQLALATIIGSLAITALVWLVAFMIG
jgi:succinate dehydrogenase / fumarate reductase cytochrome b subunit